MTLFELNLGNKNKKERGFFEPRSFMFCWEKFLLAVNL